MSESTSRAADEHIPRRSPRCPSCGRGDVREFYRLNQIPAHTVLLLPTVHEAVNYPKRDLVLAFCECCGFIFNVVFDPTVHEYSSRYEETQGFSPTFNAFHSRLAQSLIERYDLHEKNIIEIGCGKGQFLSLLCELGNNTGVGFDPSYIEERNNSPAKDRMLFVKDYYSAKYSGCHADFVCCKMTLEHISDPYDFVLHICEALLARPDVTVLFQVPNVARILQEIAFWDIYYEHCSYFSAGSLTRLFEHCGCEVLDVRTEYGDQYLAIEARVMNRRPAPLDGREPPLDELRRDVTSFEADSGRRIALWRHFIVESAGTGARIALWGGGSKAAGFLSTLNIHDEIRYVVDINPYRDDTYIAGTGQRIVAPSFLREYKPSHIIVMNPVYNNEVRSDLAGLGLQPQVLTVNQTPVRQTVGAN